MMETIRLLFIASLENCKYDEKVFVSFSCPAYSTETVEKCNYSFSDIPLFSVIKCPVCKNYIKVG